MKNNSKLLYFLIWQLIYSGIAAQLPVDSVFESITVRKIYYNDICYSFKANGSNYSILKDTVKLGQTMSRFKIKSYYYDRTNSILNLISEGNNARLISINFLTDSITNRELKGLSNICVFEDQYYFFDTKTNELIIFDNKTFSRDLISTQKILKKSDQFKTLFVAKLNQDSTLVATGYFGDGDYYSVEYHIMDDNSKTIRRMYPSGELAAILTSSVAILDYYSINNDYAFCVGGILDKNYNYYANCLQKRIKIQDIIIRDNNISQLVVLSSLDEPENKWSSNTKLVKVVAIPSPDFEYLMYKVYIGQELKEQEIKKMTLNELNLLENMAYAKHNIKFDDNYLMAYFNLYYFYFNKRKSRVSIVDDDLTEIDKKNITLIKSINIH